MNAAGLHEETLSLLPWFVNGTLGPEESALVESHVKECLSCRAELKAQRHLSALVRAQPTVHVSVEQSFEAVLDRIEKPPRTPALRPFQIFPSLPRYLAATLAPRRLASVFGALAIISLVVMLVVTQIDRKPVGSADASYTTLSGPDSSNRDAGTRVDVVFAEGMSESDIRQLLARVDGRIIAGPSDVGRYTIEIGSANASPTDLERVLDRLRQDPRVRFAGRDLMPEPSAP